MAVIEVGPIDLVGLYEGICHQVHIEVLVPSPGGQANGMAGHVGVS